MTTLRKLEFEDLEYRVSLLNEPAIAPFINTREFFTLERTMEWYNNIKDSSLRFDCVFLADRQNIGMGGLTHISEDNKNAELYMYMDPKFQGRGLGFHSARELCHYGFESLDLKKIYLYTFTENIRANRLYEKVGFKLEGQLRKHTFKDGILKDRNLYGLLKNEF